jgi:hypothetical protein
LITKELKEWLAPADDNATILIEDDRTGSRSDVVGLDVIGGTLILMGGFIQPKEKPTTAEEVITYALSYRGPAQPGPTNWQAWVGEDFPSRCAEALRVAGLLKEGNG